MTSTATGRVAPQVLEDDIQAFMALATMPDYAPRDPNVTLAAITATYEELLADRAALVHAQIAMDAVRDRLASTEQRIHKQMLDAKSQVRAQYGDDSNELAAMGLKKKSEKKSPTRRPRGNSAAGV